MTDRDRDRVATGLVRRALEIAFIVAREGHRLQPPVDPPAGLRPFLRFQALPDRALVAVRRSLDTDATFRERAASAINEDNAGRAGVLLAQRPEGWEDELATLVDEEITKRDTSASERDERNAQRRVAQLEERLRKAEETARAAKAEVAVATHALDEERARRRDAEDALANAETRLAGATSDRDHARADVAARTAERDAARADVERLTAQLVAAADEPAALRIALTEAAATAHALAESLTTAAEFRPPNPATRAEERQDTHSRGLLDTKKRVPAALPPAVFDDSVEAAEHLVRVPGALLLVDGYNATLSASPWGHLTIAEQRERLVDALAELEARTQIDVEVVFDGADVGLAPVPHTGRRPVKVLFTAAHVEADDVVIERASTAPIERVVVVASSDRRVQEGARAAGANVISASQLMAALRAR